MDVGQQAMRTGAVVRHSCAGASTGGGVGAGANVAQRAPATGWALRELHQGHFILVVVPEGQCKVGAYDGTETERTLAAYG